MFRLVLILITALTLSACGSSFDGVLDAEERASYGDGATLNHRLTTADLQPRGAPIVIERPGERWGAHPDALDIRPDIVPAPTVLRFPAWQARIGDRVRVSGTYTFSSRELSVWAAWQTRGNVRIYVPLAFPRPIQVASLRGQLRSPQTLVICRLHSGTALYPEPVYNCNAG